MRRRAIEVEVVLFYVFYVFAVVSLFAGQAKRSFFPDWIRAVPQRHSYAATSSFKHLQEAGGTPSHLIAGRALGSASWLNSQDPAIQLTELRQYAGRRGWKNRGIHRPGGE